MLQLSSKSTKIDFNKVGNKKISKKTKLWLVEDASMGIHPRSLDYDLSSFFFSYTLIS